MLMHACAYAKQHRFEFENRYQRYRRLSVAAQYAQCKNLDIRQPWCSTSDSKTGQADALNEHAASVIPDGTF